MTASTHHFATLFGQEFRITKVGECRRSSVSCNTALRFSVISGDFPLSGIALPVSTRKVTRLAVRELVLHKGKSFFAKIKIGILLYYVPILKAIFRRQFFVLVDQDKKNICSFLAAGLGISITALDFSIYAGSRKFILPLFHADHGTLLGYAKVYFPGRESFEYGENEVAILKKLAGVDRVAGNVPEVLFSGYFSGYFVVILSSLQGLRNFDSANFHHIEWLEKLSRVTGARKRFTESDFYATIQQETSFVEEYASHGADIVRDVFRKAEQHLYSSNLLFSLTKREFPFFEMLQTRTSSFIVDWEQARSDFPPIFDVFSLLMSTMRRKGDYSAVYRENLQNLFFKRNKTTQLFMGHFLKFWNLMFIWKFLLNSLCLLVQCCFLLQSGKRSRRFETGDRFLWSGCRHDGILRLLGSVP